MDIIEGSLLTAARGHSLAAVSASDSTPALNAQRLSLTFIFNGIGKPVRWGAPQMYVLSSGLYPEKQHCGCEVQVESNAAKNMVALPGSKL